MKYRLYQRNGIWWFSHYDKETGKEVRLSTRTRDKDEARSIVEEIIAPVELQKDPTIRRTTAKMVYERETVADDARKASVMRLADVPRHHPYISAKPKLSDATQKAVDGIWQTFMRYCEEHKLETVGDVTSRHAEEFLKLHGTGRYATCAHIYLRRWFDQLGAHPNPWEKRLRPKASAGAGRHREPLDKEQIAQLLDYADNKCLAEDMGTFVRFLLYTGLRLGDAAQTLVSDVDFKTGLIRRRTAKTGKVVEFPLHRDLLVRLIPLAHRDSEYLFPDACRAYRHHTLTGRFKRIFKRLDFGGAPGEYCAHCLRTTFASICAQHNVPLPVIQSWLGHSTAAVTRIYARVEDQAAKRRAIEEFPVLGWT